jgi:hypothetical protein
MHQLSWNLGNARELDDGGVMSTPAIGNRSSPRSEDLDPFTAMFRLWGFQGDADENVGDCPGCGSPQALRLGTTRIRCVSCTQDPSQLAARLGERLDAVRDGFTGEVAAIRKYLKSVREAYLASLSSLTSLSSHSRETWPEAPDRAAFHGPAGVIVDAIDPHTEADRVAILLQTLAAFGNAVGPGPYFQVEASRHHSNINVVLVGATAKGRKGTSQAHVERIMRLADPQWADARMLGGLSSGEGLIAAVRDPLVVNDEVVDSGVADKRLLVLESEFARALKVATRDGNTLSAIMRQAWDTGNLRVMTKNAAVATGTHISCIGHVTKDELLKHLGETEGANGFANRFIWVVVRRSKLLPEGGGTVDVSGLARQLETSLAFARSLGEREIRRDERARAIWIAAYAELSKDRPGMAGAVLARVEAQVMRLALIYALLDRCDTINEQHLRAALALMEFSERSVEFIFGRSLGDRVADDVLSALTAASEGMTRTDLTNHFGRHLSASRLGTALEVLVRNGLATATVEPTGGRPVERWRRCEKSEVSEEKAKVRMPDRGPAIPAALRQMEASRG